MKWQYMYLLIIVIWQLNFRAGYLMGILYNSSPNRTVMATMKLHWTCSVCSITASVNARSKSRQWILLQGSNLTIRCAHGGPALTYPIQLSGWAIILWDTGLTPRQNPSADISSMLVWVNFEAIISTTVLSSASDILLHNNYTTGSYETWEIEL